jgi:hypothetical protein
VALVFVLLLGAVACGGSGKSSPKPQTVAKTFVSIADSYVRGGQPGVNFGKTTQLRVDATPRTSAYIKFQPYGLSAPIARATLRVYALTTSSDGFEVRKALGDWSESGLTFANAPPAGRVVNLSGSFAKDGWQEIDVTRAVRSPLAPVALVLTPIGPTQLAIASRESGAKAPQLVIEARAPRKKS